MKTIFEMMSLHCVPYILYWIQAEWKFCIQTYCQIILVNFANMVAIIFFKADVHIWLTTPSPPVCICPLLPDAPPPNLQTSFMDGPILRLIPYKKYNQHFSSYFYLDSWHELAKYELLFVVVYDCILYIMFGKFLFILLVNGK